MAETRDERKLREIGQLVAWLHMQSHQHPLEVVLGFYRCDDHERLIVIDEFNKNLR